MLRILRQGQRWIMLATILLVGGAFVFFFGVGGGPLTTTGSPGDVVRVGDRHYDARDFLRTRTQQEQYYADLLGDDFDAERVSDQLDAATANLLVQRAILAEEAQRLGLRASDAEVRELIRGMDAFRGEDGRFDRERFRGFVEYEYGTERSFVEAIRTDILVRKMLSLLASGVEISEGEARDALRYRTEEIRIAYVALDPTEPPPGFAPSEEAIGEYVLNHEERIQQIYRERSDRYDQPEQVRARHILLRIPAEAGPEEVEALREQAEDLRRRIAEGADFAELAEEHSDDPGSKARGGDLGFFRRGQMVKAFDEVAFALEPGELSEVVRTDFGFHVIRAEERREARVVPLEEAKPEIARERMAEEAGREYVEAKLGHLREAIAGGATLEEAARAEGLTLERTAPLRRRPDGLIPDLGPAPRLLTAAFALEEPGASPTRVYEVDGRRVLFQLLERTPPDPEELAKELEPTRERLAQQRLQQRQTAWIGQRRSALEQAGDVVVNLEPIQVR